MAKSSLETKLADQWDPLKCRYEQPTPQCLLWVKKDVSGFFAQPPAGLFISPGEDDVTKVHALVVGPPGTPYDGGFFQFLLIYPPEYPSSPPRVRITTTDSGRVGFNTSLYANGNFCLNILGTWHGLAWSPAQCLESILVSMESFLNEKRYYNEPDTNPKRHNAALARSYIIQYETIRVAVCDMVNAALSDSPQGTQTFGEQIFNSFFASYNNYAGVAKKNISLTGRGMGVLQHGGVFDYEELLKTLKVIKRMVKKKVERGAGQANQWKPS